MKAITRILDRLNVTQRARTIIINIGLFIVAAISFVLSNPLFEIGPNGLKFFAVLTFFANALAGIVSTPNRMVPVGYDLKESFGSYELVKSNDTNWLYAILSVLKATDRLKTILVNVGILIGLVIMFLMDESIISQDASKFVIAIGFIGNALAGMLNNPDRVIPDGYTLLQRTDGTFYIEEGGTSAIGNEDSTSTRTLKTESTSTVFNF